jgi:hypothetical protein
MTVAINSVQMSNAVPQLRGASRSLKSRASACGLCRAPGASTTTFPKMHSGTFRAMLFEIDGSER